MKPLPARGLYAITDGRQGAALTAAVAAALRGGAALIQYRDKSSDHSRRYHEAHELLKICRAQGVPLIINDDVALCGELGADGVHLGSDDVAPAAARAALGADAIVGVSCYNRLPAAGDITEADYLAFGAFFASPSKPQARRAEAAVLRQARSTWPQKRLAAVGGIDAGNAAPLLEAGADYLAAITAVFAAADIEQAARTIAALFRARPA